MPTQHKSKTRITVMSKPESEYQFHFTPAKARKYDGHAEQMAKVVYNWLKERQLDKSLLAAGGDSWKLNTGVNTGMIRTIETYL